MPHDPLLKNPITQYSQTILFVARCYVARAPRRESFLYALWSERVNRGGGGMELQGGRSILFHVDGKPVTLLQVMDFLGSIPLFQQLPMASIRKIAEAVQPKQYGPSELEPAEEDGLYIIWNGELVRRNSQKVMKSGDYGTAEELQGAVASNKGTCLVLSSEHASLISTKFIWSSSDLQEGTSLTERTMQLEKMGIDVFRGFTLPGQVTFGQIFGGQLVGQALAAASKSVNPFLLVHSLHSYFLRPGDLTTPIVYQVKRVQDGRNFANRLVTAMQRDQVIFTMSASFQREEKGIEHQVPMQNAPRPEEVLPEEDVIRNYLHDPRLPLLTKEIIEGNLHKERPLDVRCCDHVDHFEPKARESRERLWFRAKGRLSEDQALHRCVAAYASDWIFLECALRPHGLTTGPDGILVASSLKMLSLDHSLWFHKSVKADEWLLFAIDSPRACSGRALVSGHIYTQEGELVISGSQEGLIRKRTQQSKL